MIAFDAETARFAGLQVFDVPAEAKEATLDTLFAHTERHLSGRSGFGGARWLVRSAGPEPGDEADARLLEYTHWSARDELDAYWAAVAQLPAGVREVVKQHSLNTYRLDAVITGADAVQMTMEPGDSRVAMVVMMEPVAGQQAEVNLFNQRETRDFFATYAGFVGTAFHLADGSDGVVEYIQWESMAAFQAAAADPRFRHHLETLGRLCESQVGMYTVGRAVDAVPGLS